MQLGERIAFELVALPALAAVFAAPELSVGEAGDETALERGQRIRHRGQRLRKPARYLAPGAVTTPVDQRLRVATAVAAYGPVLAETYQSSGSSRSTATDHV